MSTTLADVLYTSKEEASAELQESFGIRRLPGWAAVLPSVTQRVAVAVMALLEMPIGNLVFGAYQKYGLVEDARAASLESGTLQIVQLMEHTIQSKQNPKVELEVNGVVKPLLTLDLVAEVSVEVVTLTLERGLISGTEPGKATASIVLSVGDVELARAELKPVDLGGPHEVPSIDLTTVRSG